MPPLLLPPPNLGRIVCQRVVSPKLGAPIVSYRCFCRAAKGVTSVSNPTLPCLVVVVVVVVVELRRRRRRRSKRSKRSNR